MDILLLERLVPEALAWLESRHSVETRPELAGDPSALTALDNGARWIRSVQNPDGGWGESCAGYDEGRIVVAPSTVSQTSWALLGLAAAGDVSSHAVECGVRYLLDQQKPDGTWDERLATGTGFPRVFYLTYHLYRNYFPILALSECRPGPLRPENAAPGSEPTTASGV